MGSPGQRKLECKGRLRGDWPGFRISRTSGRFRGERQSFLLGAPRGQARLSGFHGGKSARKWNRQHDGSLWTLVGDAGGGGKAAVIEPQNLLEY
jgi:hypothetical protein